MGKIKQKEKERILERRTGLKKDYIKVKRKNSNILTYGGDQGFFGTAGTAEESRKKKSSGCGVVAFSDLLLYLGGRNPDFCIAESRPYLNRILEEEEYIGYFNKIYSLLGGIPFKGGVSFLKLLFGFNRIAHREGWKLRAAWGFSGKKMNGRIEEMLNRDIPVILCIPMMLLKKDGADGLWLYQMPELTRAAFTNGHYVMITGIIYDQSVLYYEVSSWGKKYYIKKNEYDTLTHTHFMGTILGNILYIR